MKRNCPKNSTIQLYIALGLIIVLSSCTNNKKHQAFLDKQVDVTFICDSINLFSEVSFFNIYFHVINYSYNDIIISFNNEHDTLSKTSLVFISSKKDTIPIWYSKIDLGINMFEKRSETFFIGMIERKKFSMNYDHFGNNMGSIEYFKHQLPFSKIIYVPEQTKFINNVYMNHDTLVSIKGYIDVDMKNTKIIYQGNTRSESDKIEFRTRKL